MGSVGAMRLFVGVEVSEAAGRSVQAVVDAWRDRLPPMRWFRPEDRHVTLAFLGDVVPEAVPELTDRLRRVAAGRRSFPMILGGIGGFPSGARARVVWVGLDDSGNAWRGLASAASTALADLVPTGSPPFVPHITLARSARPIAIPRALLEMPGALAGGLVEASILFRSHTDDTGARYERLERFPLGAVR